MGGVSPGTCWAIKKQWNNEFYYTVASCWFFLWDLYYDARIHEHQKGTNVAFRQKSVHSFGKTRRQTDGQTDRQTWPPHYSPRCANLAEKRNAGTRVCCAANFRSDKVFRLQPTAQLIVAKHTNKNKHRTANHVTACNSTYLHCHANPRFQNVYIKADVKFPEETKLNETWEFVMQVNMQLLSSLTHYSGRVTQICVFNTVKLGTSASYP